MTSPEARGVMPGRIRRRLALLIAAVAGSGLASLVAIPAAQAYGVSYVGTWTFQSGAGGENVPGICLDSNASGSVYPHSCNGGDYQKWLMYYTDYGRDELVDKATGRCLDSNSSGSVYTLPCNGGAYQGWRFSSINNGTVYNHNFVNDATGRYLGYWVTLVARQPQAVIITQTVPDNYGWEEFLL
jgi:hypothetical protein